MKNNIHVLAPYLPLVNFCNYFYPWYATHTFVFCLLEEGSDNAIHKDGMVVDPERSVVWKP